MSWEKTDVSILRQKLIERCGFTYDEAWAVKGKKKLIFEFLNRGLTYDDVFGEGGEIVDVDLDNIEPDLPTSEEVEIGEASIAKLLYAGPGWSDYVMSLFEDSELIDGKPKVAGLRRVAEALLGHVVFSGPIDVRVHYPSEPNEPGRASVTYELRIEFKLDLHDGENDWIPEGHLKKMEYPMRVFRAVAGAYVGNTDEEFAAYPEAIAETRAEARAYRKALQIDTVSHDEISDKARTSVKDYLQSKEKSVGGEYNENAPIEATQVNFIHHLSNRLDIDPNKLTYHLLEKEFNEKLTKQEGVKLIKQLNLYQTNNSESELVPKEIKK